MSRFTNFSYSSPHYCDLQNKNVRLWQNRVTSQPSQKDFSSLTCVTKKSSFTSHSLTVFCKCLLSHSNHWRQCCSCLEKPSVLIWRKKKRFLSDNKAAESLFREFRMKLLIFAKTFLLFQSQGHVAWVHTNMHNGRCFALVETSSLRGQEGGLDLLFSDGSENEMRSNLA